MSERNLNGQFAQGNPGGPGRPRRTVEREYMAALGETVTLDDWKEVCGKALADAKAGDPRARDWLARYLIGAEPPSLLSLDTDVVDAQVHATIDPIRLAKFLDTIRAKRVEELRQAALEEDCQSVEIDDTALSPSGQD